MSYLVDGHDVYWIGNSNPPAGCILIDRVAGGTPNDWGGVLDVSHHLHPDIPYTLIRQINGYELACRDAT
ncbi:hypothetical protein [Luethyella okanaganae]|uniref:Uncharacterized protein n=1 Tax=Luethyella okanaganae TaxID=69372 RepID=A0ABW1VAZ5_9MICO